MATTEKNEKDRIAFEDTIQSLEAQIANLGAHLTIDARARMAYTREIRKMADQLRNNAATGRITWAQAAQEAQETRNLIMDIVRHRSTPIGRSMAQRLKAQGYSLNELIATQTRRKYGENAVFSTLSTAQKNQVYADIVTSAGKSNPTVTRAMSRLSYAGRGLILLSLGLSVYSIATATNKTATATRELALTGAGIGGGIAGGAIAGLACGPGAPVCVTVGAFVGGALSALGLSFL
ncbi:hypothetical protein MasN3_47440 [Massilia varians]|uniref:Transmembrane protein n=1 Tax=Massilia varians TaxID=457921 RepID=A0ABN6TJE4_9BURK|nr:hypothetical protein [Massilia varians]BDT61250.1 hypothetical protein MasN3_47440 [Massilia varians]